MSEKPFNEKEARHFINKLRGIHKSCPMEVCWLTADVLEDAVKHIAHLEAQLAARNQAAEAMGVLERLVERTWGFVSIQKLPDKRRKKRWQITTDGEDFKNYSSLIEAVLKAGGADAQA